MFQFITSIFRDTKTGTTFAIADKVFTVGSKVSAFGNEGFVKSISQNGMFIEVSFAEASTTVVFTIEGKVHNWNKRPSLRKL